MDGKAPRDDGAVTLRKRLDNAEAEQQEIMLPRSLVSRYQNRKSAVDAEPASLLSPTGGGPRVRISEELARPSNRADGWESHPPRRLEPRLEQSTALYTIESRVDTAEGEARISSVRESVSLTRPRQRLSGLYNGAINNNVAISAAESNSKSAQYRDWVRRQGDRKRRWVNTPLGRLRQATKTVYKTYIAEGLLRQRPLPPTKHGRYIPLRPGLARKKPLKDSRTGRPYVTNTIRSSRYTLWNFLPKQLFFQFSNLANFYFLVIGILQMIPGLSTTGTYTTIGPLMAFVAISMAKEGFDDYRRYRLDKLENKSRACVLDPKGRPDERKSRWGLFGLSRPRHATAANAIWEVGMVVLGQPDWRDSEASTAPTQWSSVAWEDVRVGDIIRLERDENVPADLVLLNATGAGGVAYIETMALDGETNLKSKQVCRLLADRCGSVEMMAKCRAACVAEDPNMDLYKFEGHVEVDGTTMPLTINQVVSRGSRLRNTRQAMGLVVATGEECKIRMNANKNVRAKAPEMQSTVNKIVVSLVFLVALLSIGLTAGYGGWHRRHERHAWYLRSEQIPFKDILLGFVIEFNTLIPLSLYVSLEMVKLGQLFIMQDVEMYDAKTDTPMVANTTTILENLGQVGYVFSDKTGTLTENLMRLRKISVAGTTWLHEPNVQRKPTGRHSATMDSGRAKASQPLMSTGELMNYMRHKPHSPFATKARHLLLSVALCHTCVPERNSDGETTYQAASPDELALVEAARDLGYFVIDRLTQAITLQSRSADGVLVVETYQVLDVIEFSSSRKRMSIVVRMPDGRICIFTKGADSMILPRLKQHGLALRTATEVGRRASLRRSMEQERYFWGRRSVQSIRRESIGIARAASTTTKHSRRGAPSAAVSHEVDSWLTRRETNDFDQARPRPTDADDVPGALVDKSLSLDEAFVFARCFQHIDDFANEGLRTLMYASRFLDEDDYSRWTSVFQAAATAPDQRQRRVEEAAELIEHDFDLVGATAVEDKLQQGVPETIDKLRRASIHVWMLTGDKRETAINIAQSARICKPYSEVYVLDAAEDGLQTKMAATLIEVGRGMVPHSVVVVDGHTLAVVEADDALRCMLFDLAARVDSVICCRASPAQKATLVRCIRDLVPGAVTLAIGDGANDVAMIQASHVGIGISGREGLQAARIADFSVAQFRFLQRLLFVHGRWNYIRTAKYILGTFWKEMLFYLVQAQYQPHTGYTGTSLYEPTSLAVFNTLFTSLPVILLGIFEQDLAAATLLAVPELYTQGPDNRGFGFAKYLAWMAMAVVEAVIVFHVLYAVFHVSVSPSDAGLYPIGDLAFTLCVVFINLKMLVLELHNRTVVTMLGLFVSVSGWFVWNLFLGAIYRRQVGPYVVRDTFAGQFGRSTVWWLTGVGVLATLVVLELFAGWARRCFWPTYQDVVREIEKMPGVMDVMGEHADDAGNGEKGESGLRIDRLAGLSSSTEEDYCSGKIRPSTNLTSSCSLRYVSASVRNSALLVMDEACSAPAPSSFEVEGPHQQTETEKGAKAAAAPPSVLTRNSTGRVAGVSSLQPVQRPLEMTGALAGMP